MQIATLLATLALADYCAAASVSEVRVGDGEVHYLVDLSAPQTQHVDITMTFPTQGLDACEVMLPTWRPGRYTILDPAGTVYRVRAANDRGEVLPIEKIAKSAWEVESGDADFVSVSYTVYANSIGDRTRHVDPTHAFLSGSSVFFYSPRLRGSPVRVEVHAPEGWDIAGGLERAPGEAHVVVAPDYDVLVDSPLEIGLHDRIDFEVGGKPHEIVIWPPGIEYDSEQMVEDFTKIIEEQTSIFGRMPYDRYVFLVHAKQGGGGTEHLNSTIMQASREAIEESDGRGSSYKRFLGLVSHEFFHTWNVKQLRPAGIHPYDYQGENHTDLLWVSEGTTTYYSALTLVRAGLSPVKKYIDGLGSAGDAQRRNPGARVTSIAEASWDSWISSFNANTPNVRVDFYGKGSQTSLCLDMEIRSRTENEESLDPVMSAMFERYPLSGPGFTSRDLMDMLQEKCGSSFEEFFERYVFGTDELPFETALPTVGLEFYFDPAKDEDEEGEDEDEDDDDDGDGDGDEDGDQGDEENGREEADEEDDTEEEHAGDLDDSDDSDASDEPAEIPMKPYLGLRLSGGGSGSTVRALLADGPAYASGLLAGDEILTLNERRLRSGDLDDRLEDLEPGDTVTIHFLRDDELHVLEIELAAVPDGKWKVRRVKEPTEAQKIAYRSWLGQDWPEEKKKKESQEGADSEPEKEPDAESGD